MITVPRQPTSTDVFNVLQASPEWGTLEAICDGYSVATPAGPASVSTLALYLSSTATDARLYRLGSGLVVPRPSFKPGSVFAMESRTDVSNFAATSYTLVRFGTNPSGSTSVMRRVFTLAGEILPDGNCRTTIAWS